MENGAKKRLFVIIKKTLKSNINSQMDGFCCPSTTNSINSL